MEALRSLQYLVIARTTAADCVMIFLTADRAAAYEEAGKQTNATVNRAANAAHFESGMLINIEIVQFENGRWNSSDVVLIRDPIRELRQDKTGEDEGRAE